MTTHDENGNDKRSDNTVRHDKWDQEDYQQIRKEIDALPTATDALLEITHTARPEMADAFYLFKKAMPDLLSPDGIRDDHRVNRAVNEQLEDLSEFDQLRRFTKGDVVAAAMAVVKMEPELEILFDREKLRQDQADELQKLRDELADKLNQLMQQLAQQPQPGDDEGDGEDEGEGEGQGQGSGEGSSPGQGQGSPGGEGGDPTLQDEIDQLKQAIKALEDALENGLSQDAASMKAILASGMQGAVEDSRLGQLFAQMVGKDPGTLHRLPAKERLEMANKMDKERIRRIAEAFGLLKKIVFAARWQTVEGLPHEVINVTMGDDLAHLLPSELIRLTDPDLEWAFLQDYAEKRLLQYKFQGKEKLGKGGIILCEDGSGSMSGQREIEAKGIMANLLNIAKMDGREFHLIHFGGPGQFKTISFMEQRHFTVDHVMEALEIFFGGGPLRVDQRVVTPDGWKPIGAIEVGDKVYGPDGKPTWVLGVYPQGELEDVYRVTFKDGASVVCDGSHLWTVLDRTDHGINAKDGTWRTMRLKDILGAGVRCRYNGYRFSVPLTEPVEMPEANLPLDPYFLGFMLANGGLTATTPRIFSMPGDEVEWMKVLPAGVEPTNQEKRDGFCPAWALVAGRGSGTVGSGGNPLTEALRDLGLWGQDAFSKHIPEQFLWGSIEQRWALLAGLLDADGTYDKPGRPVYNTVSEKLADEIVQLVQSLGGVATLTAKQPRRSNESVIYNVAMSFNGERNPFRLARKADKWQPRHHDYIRSIVKVEPLSPAECVCIKVDREDGLFLTEGMVVTHNTDFKTALEEALRIIEDEHARTGKVKSDIVFLTDGYDNLTPQFIEDFLDRLHKIEGTCYGICLGPEASSSEPMSTFCEGRVFSLDDLQSNGGRELAAMFKSL